MRSNMNVSTTRNLLRLLVVAYLDYVGKLRMSLEKMLDEELHRHPTAQELGYQYLCSCRPKGN